MIFVTVGSMMPFDRLVKAMDRWAEAHQNEKVVAQIGSGSYLPQYMSWTRLLSPAEFSDMVRDCSILVAHAGTGSFFQAAELSKPLVIMPRLASKFEHTTDHQVQTARWLTQLRGVFVADHESGLADAISRVVGSGYEVVSRVDPNAPQPFLEKIRGALTCPVQ